MTFGEESKKPLVYSVLLHLSILAVLVVKPYFSKEVKPFQKSIKVDILAMPEKDQKIVPILPDIEETVEKKDDTKKASKPKTTPVVEKPKTQTAQKEAKKEVSKKEDKPVEAPKETNTEMDAFKKLNDLKRKEKEQEALEALKQKQKEIKGNRLSKGTGLIGVEKIEYTNYKEVLHAAISTDWELPKWLLESNLQAVVEIKIDHDGNLVYKNLVQSSGNKIYDEKVMEAIISASPFNPPPEKFKSIVMYEGVVLSFP